MDNLGVAMNATTIEAYAMSKGIETSYNEMDNATKVGLAMEMFLEKTAKYAGNYTKENETFAGSFSTLKAAIENFMSGAGSITDVTNAMVGFGEILTNSIVEMTPQIISGIATLIQNLIPQIPPLLTQILPVIIEGAVQIAQSLATIIPELVRLVTSMLPQIIDAGIQILLALVMGIVESLPELIPAMVDAILTIIDTIIDNIDLLIEAGIQIILGLIEGITEATPKLIDKLPELIVKMVGTIIKNLPQILKAGVQILLALIEGIWSMVSQLASKIGSIIKDYIITPIKEKINAVIDIGKNLVEGLWNGIKNSFTWIKNKIKGWVGDVMSFIKGLFGIHSPSTVMRDEVGKYLAQGLGVGFEKELGSVYSEMQHAIDLEQGKIQANLQTGGIYNKVFGSTPIEVNNNNTTTLEADGEVLAKVVNNVNNKRSLQYAF